jgi:hypothetical protein
MMYLTRNLALCIGNAFLCTWAFSATAPRWFVVAGVWGIAVWGLIVAATMREPSSSAEPRGTLTREPS